MLGRFLQPDPIGYADGANLYAYVGNDPLNLIDPSGLAVDQGGTIGKVQTALDLIGFDQGPIGTIANVLSAGISFSRGDFVGGVIGLGAALPLIGAPLDALKAGRITERGTGKLGAIISGSTNSAGGTVVTAAGRVVGSDFAGAVNSGLMRGGPVNILSGAHGEVSGLIRAERSFFEADKAAFGNLPGVTVFDITRMAPGEISALLRGPGTTIGAFCESGICLAPLR